MATFRDRYTAAHFAVLNFLVKLLGIGSILAGTMGLLTFVIAKEHPLFALALGVFGIICGVAFLRVKRLQPADVEGFRDKWLRR